MKITLNYFVLEDYIIKINKMALKTISIKKLAKTNCLGILYMPSDRKCKL